MVKIHQSILLQNILYFYHTTNTIDNSRIGQQLLMEFIFKKHTKYSKYIKHIIQQLESTTSRASTANTADNNSLNSLQIEFHKDQTDAARYVQLMLKIRLMTS